MFLSKDGLNQSGTTLIELIVSFVVFAIVVVSVFSLLISLVGSSSVAKNKAIASTLATNQMEYLKSLPYDSLAVAGGSIYATNPLPATTTQTVNGLTYVIKTNISYVDDAYDGCASYPTQTIKQLFCRNYPPPTGAPVIDTNPEDYKIMHVSVQNNSGAILATEDSEVAARVAETSSATGALVVTVIDDSGNPISGALVNVVNNTLVPALNLSDTSDSNGVTIFYGMPPDSNADYNVTVSDSGYSTLSTIASSGPLQATYPNQTIVVQKSSSSTLTLRLQGNPSLLVQAVDTSGNPISGMKLYLKGGYKKYTSTSDTQYYYDNKTPDTRPVTNSSGLVAFTNLVPGSYYFCGDNGSTNCSVGSITYYLVSALPYSGNNSFNPITVPIFDPSNPPTTTYPYGGTSYLQKVQLVFTTSSSFPRISTISSSSLSLSSTTLSSFSFTLNGSNMPCSSVPGSCSTTVKLIEGSNTYTASCIGTSGAQLSCTVNLTGISPGFLMLYIQSNGANYTTPNSPPLGGINVTS